MINETTYYATKGEADSYGASYVGAWGWGYSARYWVAYSTHKQAWACYASRFDSCD